MQENQVCLQMLKPKLLEFPKNKMTAVTVPGLSKQLTVIY